MAAAPGVQQSCVVVHTDGSGNHRLAAYFVAAPETELNASAFGEFFGSRLPAHMRPSSYTRLAELPLTVNGKLDQAALPSPSMMSSAGEHAVPQPLSGTEGRVARIFEDVLGLQRIGPDDNFFDCGGTSLLLITAHLRLQTQFEKPIPVTMMFECPTVRLLAKRLSSGGSSSSERSAVQQQAQKARGAFARARAAKGMAS